MVINTPEKKHYIDVKHDFMTIEFIPAYMAGVGTGMTLMIIVWGIYEHYAIKDRKKSMDKYVNSIKQSSQNHIDYLYQTINTLIKLKI